MKKICLTLLGVCLYFPGWLAAALTIEITQGVEGAVPIAVVPFDKANNRTPPPQDVAGILGKVLERKVTYKDVPFKMFSKAAVAQGYPLSDIAHLRYYAEELRAGAYAVGAPTDHVRDVTGVEPEGFASIARRYVQDPATCIRR